MTSTEMIIEADSLDEKKKTALEKTLQLTAVDNAATKEDEHGQVCDSAAASVVVEQLENSKNDRLKCQPTKGNSNDIAPKTPGCDELHEIKTKATQDDTPSGTEPSLVQPSLDHESIVTEEKSIPKKDNIEDPNDHVHCHTAKILDITASQDKAKTKEESAVSSARPLDGSPLNPSNADEMQAATDSNKVQDEIKVSESGSLLSPSKTAKMETLNDKIPRKEPATANRQEDTAYTSVAVAIKKKSGNSDPKRPQPPYNMAQDRDPSGYPSQSPYEWYYPEMPPPPPMEQYPYPHPSYHGYPYTPYHHDNSSSSPYPPPPPYGYYQHHPSDPSPYGYYPPPPSYQHAAYGSRGPWNSQDASPSAFHASPPLPYSPLRGPDQESNRGKAPFMATPGSPEGPPLLPTNSELEGPMAEAATGNSREDFGKKENTTPSKGNSGNKSSPAAVTTSSIRKTAVVSTMKNDGAQYVPPIRNFVKPKQLPNDDRRSRKNAMARYRCHAKRELIEAIEAKAPEERTEQEIEMLEAAVIQKSRKNNRSRSRSQEQKEQIKLILAKPMAERTEAEIKFVETHAERKKRKNEGDRLRRNRLKLLGLDKEAKITVTARGPLPAPEVVVKAGGHLPPPGHHYALEPAALPPYGWMPPMPHPHMGQLHPPETWHPTAPPATPSSAGSKRHEPV